MLLLLYLWCNTLYNYYYILLHLIVVDPIPVYFCTDLFHYSIRAAHADTCVTVFLFY